MPMPAGEQIQALRRASEEITTLRNQIAMLAPKAEAYDTLVRVVGLIPGPSRGMGEDMAWVFRRRADELQAELDASKKPVPPQVGD